MSQDNSIQKYFKAAALLLFLVGLPLGSWYYLQAGFSYHEDLMKELKTYSSVPADLTFVNQKDQTITSQALQGKKVVATFLDISSSDEEVKLKYLREMIRQFKDRPELIFVLHGLNPTEDTPSRFRDFVRSDEIDMMVMKPMKHDTYFSSRWVYSWWVGFSKASFCETSCRVSPNGQQGEKLT